MTSDIGRWVGTWSKGDGLKSQAIASLTFGECSDELLENLEQLGSTSEINSSRSISDHVQCLQDAEDLYLQGSVDIAFAKRASIQFNLQHCPEYKDSEGIRTCASESEIRAYWQQN